MRRRAMAHNQYRIPVRIRLRALQDLTGSEAPGPLKRSKCRKHRRKLRYLTHLYEIRQKRYRWLETHVWHSKRFKMENMAWNGGCRIPLNCNDKSTRCIYKLCQKESTCIMDQSYFVHYWIQNEKADEILALRNFQKVNIVSNLQDTSQKQEYKAYSQANELLGFFDVLKIQKHPLTLLIIHPSIVQEVCQIVQDHHKTLEIKPVFMNNF